MEIGEKVKEHLSRKKGFYWFVLGFVLGLILCSFAEIRNISVGPTGGVDVQMRDQNDPEHFRSVWENADRKSLLLSLLAERGVYPADDPNVVKAISELCAPIPKEPLTEFLSAAEDCAEKPVPKLLRQLAEKKKLPFHPVGRTVRVGVPSPTDQPKVGSANTCLEGEFYRRQVLLTNPRNGRQVAVRADRHYGEGIFCGALVGAADLQLNEKDAFAIFDGPLNKFEEALALVVN